MIIAFPLVSKFAMSIHITWRWREKTTLPCNFAWSKAFSNVLKAAWYCFSLTASTGGEKNLVFLFSLFYFIYATRWRIYIEKIWRQHSSTSCNTFAFHYPSSVRLSSLPRKKLCRSIKFSTAAFWQILDNKYWVVKKSEWWITRLACESKLAGEVWVQT